MSMETIAVNSPIRQISNDEKPWQRIIITLDDVIVTLETAVRKVLRR